MNKEESHKNTTIKMLKVQFNVAIVRNMLKSFDILLMRRSFSVTGNS